MTAQLHLDDVAAGDELPPVVRSATRAQLFLYSAATWNPHRIHYDREYAATEGHPDLLVHGPLQGAWLTQYVTDWAGPLGRLVAVAWQNRASAFPDEPLEFGGTVTAVDAVAGRVDLDVWERNAGGTVLMPATAAVTLPRRS